MLIDYLETLKKKNLWWWITKMNREKILKDLARSLKVEVGQSFRILTKPFENDIIRITNDTLEVNCQLTLKGSGL